MMKNLAVRKEYWNLNFTPFDSLTTTNFLNRNLELFRGKHVLEIGPGAGRQFSKVFPFAASYSVADISPVVLALPNYDNVCRYLMLDYRMKDGGFDMIHFWFLIHHVRLVEIPAFFKFIHKHLGPNGLILFNYPKRDTYGSDLRGDGMGTSPILDQHIVNGSERWFTVKETFQDDTGNDHSVSMIMQRK